MAAVLVQSVLAVVLLDAAGFDHRVAAGSVAILACDVFASWSLITTASYGSRRRMTRTSHGDNHPGKRRSGAGINAGASFRHDASR